jgi:hypothetical protein
VRDVDGERDLGLGGERGRARAGEVADLLLHGRDGDEVARAPSPLREPPRGLERDVTADPVVERTGDGPAAVQRERRPVPQRGVARPDELLQLVAVLRADVEEEVLVLDRLALLPAAAAELVQARRDHTRERPLAREHVDPLADHRVRVEAADRSHRGDAVVAEVRDDDADLVDVPDDGEGRPAGGPGHADPRAAEDVGRDLADGRGGLAPHLRRGALLTGRSGRRQQPFEQLGKGHGGRTLPAPPAAAPR